MLCQHGRGVACLECDDTIKRLCADLNEARGEASSLRAELAEVRTDLTSAEATIARLREALSLAEVDVALERSWCRICRTEGRGGYRGRDVHPHTGDCLLARLDAARKEVG